VPLTLRAIQDIIDARGDRFVIGFHPDFVMPRWTQRRVFYLSGLKLVLYPFHEPVSGGGGIDFQIDDGVIDSDGVVDITDRGAGTTFQLRPRAFRRVKRSSLFVRQRFVFTPADASPDARTIWLNGMLVGDLDAGQAGASVDVSVQLFDTDGVLLDKVNFYDEAVSLSVGNPASRTFRSSSRLRPN